MCRGFMVFEDEYCFEEIFFDDIESWFSADIACCDNCYDDFLEKWPLAYAAEDSAFQRCGIDLETFYSGSRTLQDLYSKDQFWCFVKDVKCPRCGESLTGCIWPYDLPFDTDEATEEFIDGIAELAQRTPFLLLTHDFARQVYEAICSLASTSVSARLETSLFRARVAEQLSEPIASDFDAPPKSVVVEGRYNHAGNPVLYLASDSRTCFFEMREQPIVVAEIYLKKPIKILDLIDPFEAHAEHGDVLGGISYSALVSSFQEDDGWHKPKYVFSRFLADCARDAGFDAIKYPSTRLMENNFNLVLVNSNLTLQEDANILRFIEMSNK